MGWGPPIPGNWGDVVGGALRSPLGTPLDDAVLRGTAGSAGVGAVAASVLAPGEWESEIAPVVGASLPWSAAYEVAPPVAGWWEVSANVELVFQVPGADTRAQGTVYVGDDDMRAIVPGWHPLEPTGPLLMGVGQTQVVAISPGAPAVVHMRADSFDGTTVNATPKIRAVWVRPLL